MKKYFRMILLAAVMGLMALCLSGCDLLKPIESLYALPALPEEHSKLQASIQAVIDELDAEYASISYGNYTSTIQLLDLDSDGEQETAAVSLRVASAEEKPLRICLFHRGRDDTYSLSCTIEGEGLTIHSVSYEDLTGDGVREVIVSWQLSNKAYAISAYQITANSVVQLLYTSYNERYLTVDLDNDNAKEIVVFHLRTSEDEVNRAEYYRYQDSTMVLSSTANLSGNISDITSARESILSDGIDGIYVTSDVEGGELTDILVLQSGELRNVTLDAETGVSQITLRGYTEVEAADIDQDGVLDIPLPVLATKLSEGSESDYYIIYWRRFNSQGNSELLDMASYHSITDGWCLTLPNSWLGKITVARDDSRSIYGERAVVFYYWPDTENTTPTAFLTIYRLTGDNRYTRAKLTGRSTLLTDSSAIYCANLNGKVWDCGLDTTGVAARFSLITAEWSSE